MKKRYLALLCGSLAIAANTALADGWPMSVVGTYSVLGNQHAGTLRITSQGASGLCRRIVGSIYNYEPIEGFYCPYSGRIHFVRKSAANNDTTQVWTGNLSQAGPVLRVGGTFTAVNAAGGSLGEYNFNASK